MRLNQYIALASGLSRRAADKAIIQGRVLVNDATAHPGMSIKTETVLLDGTVLVLPSKTTTIMLNKLVGYVCSRHGQGSKTIYSLLPTKFHNLKSVGRLDKNSSGLLLLTNNGSLTQNLSHPSNQKLKIYEVSLDKPLAGNDLTMLVKGVSLQDGISKLLTVQITSGTTLRVGLAEGRNRQIRRTFKALGYEVESLHRTSFGEYKLGNLPPGKIKVFVVK